jgi:hypothetical protein
MRTKALLGLAALAVSVATCVAQSNVYSLNIVGYVNVDLAQGMNLIANPLKPSNGNYNITNTIVGLPDTAENAAIYKWGGAGWSSTVPTWIAGYGWSDPLVIDLGESFFINTPVATKVTFVGEVATGTINYSAPAGTSFIAPKTPVEANFPGKDVGHENDAIYTWAGSGWSSASWTYISGFGWSSSDPAIDNVDGPKIPVGKGIVYQNTGAKIDWTRTFNP